MAAKWRVLGRLLGVLVLLGAGLGMVIAAVVVVVVHGPPVRLALVPVFAVAAFALDYAAVRVLRQATQTSTRIAQARSENPQGS